MLAALKEPVPVRSKADLDCAIADKWEQDGDLEQAFKTASAVLDDDPDNIWALLIAGRICTKRGNHGVAFNLLWRAMEIAPNRVDLKRNFAAAAIGTVNRREDARRVLRELRNQQPDDYRSLALLCLLAVHDSNPRLAIELGNKALALKADQFDVIEFLGYAHLMLGDWEKGWDGYERFIGHSKYRPLKPPRADCPYWKGEEGLNLYIRGEQGLGDEISFASVLPDVIGTQKSIVLDCDEKLGGLFARSFPAVEVHATRKAKIGAKDWLKGRAFDAHCLIGSLAYQKRSQDSDFPGTAYLVADPERRVQWRSLLDTLPGKKVGIAWTGGYKNTFRSRRSLSLKELWPVLRVPGVSWVSLQYQDPTDDIRDFVDEYSVPIKHWPRAAESQDYDDVAALVAELDLVISVCTAAIHLCGALGKECWVLVPNKPRWFYQLSPARLPWYSTVELFRQGDEWPLHEVARRLKDKLQ